MSTPESRGQLQVVRGLPPKFNNPLLPATLSINKPSVPIVDVSGTVDSIGAHSIAGSTLPPPRRSPIPVDGMQVDGNGSFKYSHNGGVSGTVGYEVNFISHRNVRDRSQPAFQSAKQNRKDYVGLGPYSFPIGPSPHPLDRPVMGNMPRRLLRRVVDNRRFTPGRDPNLPYRRIGVSYRSRMTQEDALRLRRASRATRIALTRQILRDRNIPIGREVSNIFPNIVRYI